MMASDIAVVNWRAMSPATWAEHSLGWLGENGAPITLEPWQRAILDAWWEHRDEITTAAISNCKKTGKTLVNAVLTCWRWLALPTEHFCAANDLDQSSGRQFLQIVEMVRRHPWLHKNVTITQRQLTFKPTGSTLTALATDAAGNAGSNHLTASHTEAWGILYEAGIRAWEELTPPPGERFGFPALRIADSYAGFAGESETWHNLVDRGLSGERISEWPIYKNAGLLLFHMDGFAAQGCFRGTPEQAAAYYADQRNSLREHAFRRMHLNIRTSGESQFIPMEWWERACTGQPVATDTQMHVICGVDASLKRDSAAISVCTFDGGKVRLVASRVFHPSKTTPLDIEETLEQSILDLEKRFRIREVRYDPWQFARSAQGLAKQGIPMVEYAQTVPNLTSMSMNLYELLKGENFIGYLDEDMRKAIEHAVVLEGARGQKLAKEKASHKIDLLVATAMAALGAVELLGRGPATLKIGPNPFYGSLVYAGDEFDRRHLDWRGFDTRSHPPGVSWQNCKRRNKGCKQCEQEWKQEQAAEEAAARN